MSSDYSLAVEKFREGNSFLVVSHLNPEGDAIGSLLGMALALRAAGKDAVAYLEDPLPALFDFLPGSETIVHDLTGLGPFDATFAVDCGQKERLGPNFNLREDCGTLINIDHHATNDAFGDINIIEADASAAGEMVFDFVNAAGIKVGKDVAVNLYVAIHTDTGSFRYSSSRPEAFKKAGELVALGADPWEVSTQVYENLPERRFALLGLVLNTLEVFERGGVRLASLLVTGAMMDSTNATKDDSDGFVNYARSVEGVEVGMLFRESSPSSYKVSLRSKGRVDVAAIAKHFGGGGHKNAAGFVLEGELADIKKDLYDALDKELSDFKG